MELQLVSGGRLLALGNCSLASFGNASTDGDLLLGTLLSTLLCPAHFSKGLTLSSSSTLDLFKDEE